MGDDNYRLKLEKEEGMLIFIVLDDGIHDLTSDKIIKLVIAVE